MMARISADSYLTANGSTSPEADAGPDRRIEIYDVTLRDGEQQPGTCYSPDEKLQIVAALDAAGVSFIETGMIAASGLEAEVARTAAARERAARIFVLVRSLEADIDLAAKAGVDGVTIEAISNPVIAEQVFRWPAGEAVAKARRAVAHARACGLSSNLFLVDATRTSATALASFTREISDVAAPDTVTIADTFGVASPRAMAAYVAAVKKIGLPVWVHCHNEYGLAVANTCAGLEAGAFGAHTSFNGMGERAGNAATEDVVMAGTGPYRWDAGIDPTHLRALSRLVALRSGAEPAPNKSVVGVNLFDIESGTAGTFYEALQSRDLRHFYAYTPESLGTRRRVFVGKLSGAANLRLKADELGRNELRERAAELLPLAKERAAAKHGSLSDDDLLELLRD
jgi:isopropylmalate/homocitrate/citramalate synthase